ncbi:MAG: DUF192 domain-containing protein [Anaerolineales bacterium]|nr:MAG: DUF192 domain-containing protein [Anaerolineales bacterium]
MSKWGSIVNLSRSGEHVANTRWCSSFLCRLRGLTFRRSLEQGEGLLLVEGSESRANTAIHMWMVFFPITAAWLDKDFRIVDLRLAKPWRVYIPSAPAKYVLEGAAEMMTRISLGDQLEWRDDE